MARPRAGPAERVAPPHGHTRPRAHGAPRTRPLRARSSARACDHRTLTHYAHSAFAYDLHEHIYDNHFASHFSMPCSLLISAAPLTNHLLLCPSSTRRASTFSTTSSRLARTST
eukprot:6213400-Pleurochrysis_carterae.AAC.2